jgi:predicted DCC family thiol-disulfide oxidoreductase YuxK
MSTEVAQRELMLVYDGDCPMCIGAVAWLQRRGLVTVEQAVSNHELAPAELEVAQAAGIRNQLVVLDPNTRATRTGADGLLWLVGENRGYPRWVKFLSLPAMRQLVRLAYEAISYNRRIISPPRHAIHCDCEPQATIARRLTLVGPLAVVAVGLVALWGAAMAHSMDWSESTGAALAILAAGAGWLATGSAAMVLLRGEPRVDYVSHLVFTAFIGAVVLVPMGIAAWWLPAAAAATLTAVSLAVAFAVMFRMQRRRVVAAGVSARWLWAWTGFVPGGFVGVTFVGIALGRLP